MKFNEKHSKKSYGIVQPALLILSSLVFTLVTFEVGVRLCRYFDPSILEGIYLYSELKGMVGSYYQPSPFNTFELKPGFRGFDVSHEHPGEKVSVSINNLGLRGPDTTLDKPKGVKRVLALGDSFTFGLYVNDGETYPAVLQKLLDPSRKRIEVLNAGYTDGWCPDENLAWLINKGLELQPDLVIFGLFMGSRIECLSYVPGQQVWEKVDSAGLPLSVKRLYQAVDLAGRVRSTKETGYTVGGESIYRWPVLRESYAAIMLSKVLAPPPSTPQQSSGLSGYDWLLRPDSNLEMKAAEDRFWLVLDGMRRVSEEHAAKFMVVNLPPNFEVHERLLDRMFWPGKSRDAQVRRHFFKEIEPMLNKRGIPYVDLVEPMKADGRRFYPEDGEVHMNAVGEAFTAQTLLPLGRRLLLEQK